MRGCGGWLVGLTLVGVGACGPAAGPSQDGDGTGSFATTGGSGAVLDEGSTGPRLDAPPLDTAGPECVSRDGCDALDILFVVDDSGSMQQELLNLSRNLPGIMDELLDLRDPGGNSVHPSINLMVTTTDMGHPLCVPPPGDAPRMGAPVRDGCNARIERFTSPDPVDPVVLSEACTEVCPVDVVPDDHFIHFDTLGSNVPANDVAAAFSCLVPQGVGGCDYQAPLEAMLRAIDPAACWNDPARAGCDESEWAQATAGFLRPDASLVIVLVSDGLDCSVSPEGYSTFTDMAGAPYWSVDPQLGVPAPSPAICFNAGVACDDADGDGVYESCTSSDDGVLHPVQRYVSALEEIVELRGKDVVMLGILGVPEVVEHSPSPPFEPTAGGVFDVQYRHWIDFPYPNGDILPADWDAGRRAVDLAFENGDLGPGCTGMDGNGELTGQAQPPVRMREVCESLDRIDPDTGEVITRCCIESICDTDVSPAFRCLSVLIEAQLFGE